MNNSTMMASRSPANAQHAKDNEAWGLVVAWETGRQYLSKTEIARQAGIAPRKVDQMIGRIRNMRRAVWPDGRKVEFDHEDWWAARMTPMPVPGAMPPATVPVTA
jgi:hypothetical protein